MPRYIITVSNEIGANLPNSPIPNTMRMHIEFVQLIWLNQNIFECIRCDICRIFSADFVSKYGRKRASILSRR